MESVWSDLTKPAGGLGALIFAWPVDIYLAKAQGKCMSMNAIIFVTYYHRLV